MVAAGDRRAGERTIDGDRVFHPDSLLTGPSEESQLDSAAILESSPRRHAAAFGRQVMSNDDLRRFVIYALAELSVVGASGLVSTWPAEYPLPDLLLL
jgi:hypothetical protein